MGKVLSVLVAVLVVVGVAVGVRLLDPDGAPAPGAAPTRGEAGTGEVPDDAVLATVVSHVDGDTLRLAGHERSEVLRRGEDTTVRLLEIDTPEHGRSGRPEECFADEASRALRDKLPVGAEVWVAADRDLRDPYGRTLLYLWTGSGELVNLSMIREGYAEAVLFEPNDAFIDLMRAAETDARAEGRGMWGACPGG